MCLKPRLTSVKQFAQEHFTRKGTLDLKAYSYSLFIALPIDFQGEHAFTLSLPETIRWQMENCTLLRVHWLLSHSHLPKSPGGDMRAFYLKQETLVGQ